MTTTTLASPSHRTEFVSLLVILALGFGGLAARRIEPTGQLDLLAVTAGSVAAGITVVQSSASRRRTWSAMSIVAAAIVALGKPALGVDSWLLDASIWVCLSIGIACWSLDVAGLARHTLISCAGLALVLPLLVALPGNSSRDAATLAFAAVCSSVAFATFLDRVSTVAAYPARRAHGYRPLPVPGLLLWIAAGGFSLAACASEERTWSLLTMLTVAAVFVVESLEAPALGSGDFPALSNAIPKLIVFVALTSASGLAVASVAAGTPFGWPVAGVAVAAVVSLTAIGKDAMLTSTQLVNRLRDSERESRVDALTGISNRRGLDERLREEVARATRYGHPLSLLMIDIDDFKQINDRFGHASGDEVLQSLARLIEQAVRTIDITARYGGEEFVVLLPETDLDGAAVVADRICKEMSQQNASTVSIGAAELSSLDLSPAMLLERADGALYRAKRQGKNQVELAR